MVRLTNTERHQVKLHGARELAEKEIREGSVDPVYVRKQIGAWELEALEKACGRADTGGGPCADPVPPGLARPTGQGRDSLGRGLDESSAMAAVMANGAVQREREALGSYLTGTYRDPAAAHAALSEVVNTARWEHRVEQQAKEAARWQARQEDRERRLGLGR